MATSTITQEQQPKAVAEHVRNALRTQGVKVKDLTDEQRERALAASDENGGHYGLRGKSVAEFVLDGAGLRAQEKVARDNALLAASQAEHERRSAAAKAAGIKPPRRVSYPPEIAEAVKAAKKTAPGGREYGPGPKHHMAVREVVAKELKLDADDKPAKQQVLDVAGFAGEKELRAAADGKNRDALKTDAFLALSAKTPKSWAQGRDLAAILAAWIEQL